MCVGGSCRRSKGHAKVLSLVQSTGIGSTIPCQDICKGPVVGIRDRTDTRWYRRVRGDTRRAFERFLRFGTRPKALRAAEVLKCRNKVRHGRRQRPMKG